jgi:hypothetical protein
MEGGGCFRETYQQQPKPAKPPKTVRIWW